MKTIIHGTVIITPRGALTGYALVFEERILGILPEDAAQGEVGRHIHRSGTLVPGFIDIHIHGGTGYDVMDATEQALEAIAQGMIHTGTTAFLATTMTMAQADIERAIEAVRVYQPKSEQDLKAASILGVHLEGPFINPDYKGAQAPEHIQKPTPDWIMPHLDVVKMITFAPEMDENFAFTKAMQSTDVVLSIGHSGSDYETALEAYVQGVHHVTHCFNACTGLHHRKPGVVGAALAKPFSVDIITDGIHIHPGFIGPFVHLKGVEHTVLITDAMRAALMPEGTYDLGGQTVVVEEGACRLENGVLAGSIHTTEHALQNMLRLTNFTYVEISKMLSENPAKLLGCFDERGSLDPGKWADMVLLDADHTVCTVYKRGHVAYERAGM